LTRQQLRIQCWCFDLNQRSNGEVGKDVMWQKDMLLVEPHFELLTVAQLTLVVAKSMDMQMQRWSTMGHHWEICCHCMPYL